MIRHSRHFAIAAAFIAAFALAGASSAHAQRPAKQSRNAATYPNSSSRVPAYDPKGTSRNPFGPGQNLPYPDRPYGDPGRW